MRDVVKALILTEAARRPEAFDEACALVWAELEDQLDGPLAPILEGRRITDAQIGALAALFPESEEVLRTAAKMTGTPTISESDSQHATALD